MKKILAIILLALSPQAFGAVAATTVWELRATATAADANGGGYVPGSSGTDYSQQDSAQYNLTSVTTAGANAIMLTASASADMVGNIAHVVSGTNFTAGWYQILSVSAGVSITVDRNATTGVGAAGVVNIGGAISLNSTNDSAFFGAGSAGNIYYIKNGSFTLGQAVVAGTAGTAANTTMVIGYNSARGDTPSGANRPTLSGGANAFTAATFWWFQNLIFTGTSANVFSLGVSDRVVNVKAVNTSTTAGRSAASISTAMLIQNSEFISYRGVAMTSASIQTLIEGCYFHDSDIGFKSTSSSTATPILLNNIFEGNVTAAIQTTAAIGNLALLGNTIYGAENKLGTGVSIATGSNNNFYSNNIIYGASVGINDADVLTSNVSTYNDFFNNTSDVTNWVKGATDLALNPTFQNVTQSTGTGASTSGSVLTLGSGTVSANVTDGVDFLFVSATTGGTVGQQKITSHTSNTITTDLALGTGSSVSWQITSGHNFKIGAPLTGQGFPGLFPAGLTQGFLDPGAAQRRLPVKSYSGAGG